MSAATDRISTGGLASLRRLVERRPAADRCELCAAGIPDEHQHLVEPQARHLVCVCVACAILFDDSGVTRYRRVPRDVRELVGFQITDGFWNGLGIPIGLVFFFRSSTAGQTLAIYPSPAGPTETIIEEDLWAELAAQHPALARLRPDVEALLVNRVGRGHAVPGHYIVPIDECYKLTGLIRRDWRGFSGGDLVWQSIAEFFARLKEMAHRA